MGAAAEIQTRLTGSVGDGPIVNAQMTVLSADGSILETSVSDQEAGYNIELKVKGKHYPLIIKASGGTDLVTLRAADFTLYAAALSPGKSTVANLNPFSTLAVATARRMSGGLTTANLHTALRAVAVELNSGLPPIDSFNPMTSPVDDGNFATLVKASETLAEILRRTQAAVVAANPALTVDGVIDALGADLVDGVIDGAGASGSDAKIAAAAILASSQVVVESMINELRVDGRVVTTTLDDVIAQLSDGASTTAELAVTAPMIEQAETGIDAAAMTVDPASLDALASGIDSVSPGMLPAEVRTVLSADAALLLDPALTQIAMASPTLVDTIIGGATGDGVIDDGGSDGVESPNGAPILSGTPAASALVGSSYAFEPNASDADGDLLTFRITNKPGWASFDTTTGALTGTPGEADLGTYEGISISVTDGLASATLGPFSIAVEAHAPGTATLTWAAPTQTADGSPLADLAGFKVYWGSESGKYTSSVEIANSGVSTYVVENLSSGTHYFTTTAFTASGLESAFSNEVSKTIQ